MRRPLPLSTGTRGRRNKAGMEKRIWEIDLLRGLAILGMVFSGLQPHGGALPAWMYHAQVPPPDHIFNPSLPGLTWVDLVFPFFLFAMGAAVPVVLPGSLARHGLRGTLRQMVVRFGLLLLLAVLSFNFAPGRNAAAGGAADWAGIGVFLALFLLIARIPGLRPSQARYLKWAGVFGLCALIYLKHVSWGGFDPSNNDPILRVLANVYVVGTLLWLVSQHNKMLRIALLFLVTCAYLGDLGEGFLTPIWRWHDPWNLVSLYLLKYLMLFLPGTIAGEWLLRGDSIRNLPVFGALVMVFILTAVVLGGLFARETLLVLGIALLALTTFSSLRLVEGDMLRAAPWFYGGMMMLIGGLLMEPFQGGVKKDPSTLSYFFITGGLAFAWIQSFRHWEHANWSRWVAPVQQLGQQALMAYFLSGFFIVPLWNLTGLSGLFAHATPWLLLKAILITGLVVVLARLLTSRSISWKV